MCASHAANYAFGSCLLPDGSTRFRVWAPQFSNVGVALQARTDVLPMLALADGWHELFTDQAPPGSRYYYALPNGQRVPDPASRYQPDDVHGASEVMAADRYRWGDGAWQGAPWHTAVIYELHIGAFTPAGTFLAAIERLDYLAALGITAIQIMPVADFPGRFNWGYDGVYWYAPDAGYGHPDHFKRLVDAAHRRGLMVFLDVVYNHFGPEGNYLSTYAPQFFNPRHVTPWGPAINYDAPGSDVVREFAIENAVYWLREFHLDGLRLDAVHAIIDNSKPTLLQELATRVRSEIHDRPVHLQLENEANQASYLNADAYTAQWNDDVHHVLHCAATGEAQGYYADYCGDTAKLGRALAEGFVYQGEWMPFRAAVRGESSVALPPTAFVAFIQNHDQVGNRALGERLAALTDARKLHAIAAIYLLLPQVPMLFMGEEWGTQLAFTFFCDFGDSLAAAVRQGRRDEFARMHHAAPHRDHDWIDPQAAATFVAAKLNWDEVHRPQHADLLAWYRSLLSLRHRELVPLLKDITRAGTYEVLGQAAVHVCWRAPHHELHLTVNLSDAVLQYSILSGRILLSYGADSNSTQLGPWSVNWTIAPGVAQRTAGRVSPTL